jgi:glutaredoxin
LSGTVPKLTVLSREYCTLCHEMIAALKQFQGRYQFEIEVIDVDSSPHLEEEWGDKVPVLLDGERELCHYYLDIEAVDARLARMK